MTEGRAEGEGGGGRKGPQGLRLKESKMSGKGVGGGRAVARLSEGRSGGGAAAGGGGRRGEACYLHTE